MLEFTAELKLYVPEIDEQHKKLIDMINDFEALGDKLHDKAVTEKALDFLGKYVAAHFSTEERYMRETGYPDYDWHHNWHDGFIKKYASLQEEYAKNGPSEHFTQMLNKFVINWIFKHIQNVDTNLGKHIVAYYKANPRRK